MTKTRIVGLIVILIGVVLLYFGFDGRAQMTKARGDIDKATSIIPEGRGGGIVSGGLNRKVDEYKTPVMLCFIGGIGFVIIGGALVVFGGASSSKKKKKKR